MKKEFSRFKYAEEFAHQCDNGDFKWHMWREDRVEVEDGEEYETQVYVVEYK